MSYRSLSVVSLSVESLSVAAVLSTIALSGSPARADDVPALRVDEICHGIVSQSTDPLAGGEPTVSFDRCMQAEQEDRDQLRKAWSGFTAADKSLCLSEATRGGEASYTELITCLEMARAVRQLRAPAQR